MEGKKVCELGMIMSHQMNPLDANPAGKVHGGIIMKLMIEA